MVLHEWFKPVGAFAFDGKEWIDNGHMALVVDAAPNGLRVRPHAPVCLNEPVAPAERTREERGCVIFDGDERAVYAAHLVSLAEAAHPGVVWHRTRETMPTLIGLCANGNAVAAVMPRRGLPQEHDRDVRAPCPACGGDGKTADCETCKGEGEHTCSCGDEHPCDDCDGEGRVGRCGSCEGTGQWKAPPKAA